MKKPMQIKRLIYNLERLKDTEYLPDEMIDEIIERLRQLDDLKNLLHDTMDSLQDLYSFLFSLTGDYE